MPGGGVPPPPSAYMGASLEAEPAVGPGMRAGWKHCGGEVLPSTKPEAVRETHKAERLGESDRDREMGERQREGHLLFNGYRVSVLQDEKILTISFRTM